MQEFHYPQGAVGVFRIAGGDAGLGESLDEIGHYPGIPVHLHGLGPGAVVVALIFAVAAQISVLFLSGDEIVCDGYQPLADGRVCGAFVGLGGSVEPFAGVLPLPSPLPLGYFFGGEKLDGVALRAVDVLGQTSVIACVDGVAEKTPDHDSKD